MPTDNQAMIYMGAKVLGQGAIAQNRDDIVEIKQKNVEQDAALSAQAQTNTDHDNRIKALEALKYLSTPPAGVSVTLPLILVSVNGYSFDIPLAGALPNTGQIAIVSAPQDVLVLLNSAPDARVVEKDKVKVTLYPKLQISAGAKIFHVKVLK